MTTGQIIKMLREERGMTQEQLAEVMGYSHKSSINKIELGKSDLPQTKIFAFAKVFDVSPCELLGLEPPTESEEKIQMEVKVLDSIQKVFGKDSTKMFRLFLSLNEQGKQKALENLEDLTAIDKYTD